MINGLDIFAAKHRACPSTIVEFLISGAHNSIGKAQFVVGEFSRVTENFRTAVTINQPGGIERLLVAAYVSLQFAQLGISTTGPELLPSTWELSLGDEISECSTKSTVTRRLTCILLRMGMLMCTRRARYTRLLGSIFRLYP